MENVELIKENVTKIPCWHLPALASSEDCFLALPHKELEVQCESTTMQGLLFPRGCSKSGCLVCFAVR